MLWLPAASLLALGMLLFVTSALHVFSFSPLVIARQEAARDDAVREALAQHSTAATAGNDRAAPRIQLRSSEHPGAARFDIPVPPDARTPGARMPGHEHATQWRDRAMFITSGDVAEVIAFYRLELESQGWHEVRAWMSRPAHGTPGTGGAVSAFCRDIDMPAFLVGVVSHEAGLSELRLIIDAEQPGPCASSTGPEPRNNFPPPMFQGPV